MNERRIIVGLFVASAVIFSTFIGIHVIKMKMSGAYYVNQGGSELFTKWKSLQFTPIEIGTPFSEIVESAVQAQIASTKLSMIEKDQLVGTVHGMLLAFSTGNYEDYKRFRFPIQDGTFDTNRINSLYQSLIHYDPTFKTYVLDPNDPEFPWKVYERFWFASGIQTNIFCSKCWRDAALRSLNIRTFINAETVPDLKGIIGRDENVGINWWNPSFNFNPSENQMLAEYKSIDISVVSLVIETDATKRIPEQMTATPIYCLFYWDPVQQIWLPGAFGGAYSGPRKSMYLY